MKAWCVVGVCAAVAIGGVAQAQYPTWIADDGDWFDPGNWDPGVPGQEWAIINNGGTARIEDGQAYAILALGFGGADGSFGSGDGTVIQTGGVLTLGEYVGLCGYLGGLGGTRGELELVGPARLEAPQGILGSWQDGHAVVHLHDGATAELEMFRLAWRMRSDQEPVGRGELTVEGEGTTLTITGEVNNGWNCELGTRGEMRMVLRDGAVLNATSADFCSSASAGATYDILSGSRVSIGVEGVASPVYTSNFLTIGTLYLPGDMLAAAGRAVVTIDAESVIEPVADDAYFWVGLGPRSTVRGDGVIRATELVFGPDARVEPGVDGVGVLTLDGRVRLSNARAGTVGGVPLPDGGFVIDVASPTDHDRVIAGGIELGGMLRINPVDGYVPAIGDAIEVVTLTDQAEFISDDPHDVGEFERILSPDFGPAVVLQARYSIDKVELVAVCPADANLDGVVDTDDLDEFVDTYMHGYYRDEPVLDLTRDGVINFDDVDRFIESYLAGCG